MSVLISKESRFNLFVVGYASIFALLAFFGAVEASRFRVEQEEIAKEKSAQISSVTHNQALYSLPRMDVTMGGLNGPHHVQLGISLQMNKDSVVRFADFQPLVSDRIVSFLDRQSLLEFEGPHGMSTLRNDMLFEVNQASGPVVISDIIFGEFIVR